MKRNEANPHSTGTDVRLQAVLHSTAEGNSGFGAGGGPVEAQRMILGWASGGIEASDLMVGVDCGRCGYVSESDGIGVGVSA